jgi:hypothetical protein
MTSTRKLVLTAITLLVLSAVAIPQERIATAWAIVQCAQTLERALPMKSFPLRHLDPTCPQCL